MSPSVRTFGRTALIVTLLALAAGGAWGFWRMRTAPASQVYLVTYEAPRFSLATVSRERLTRDVESDPLAYSVERVAALVSGPTMEEQSKGLSSAVPEGTSVLAASFRDGELTVNLSFNFADGGGTASMQARLEQIRWTLTEAAVVERLTLEMDGRPLDVLGGEGLWLDPTWSRVGAPAPSW